MDGAILSAVNLDNGVKEYFPEDKTSDREEEEKEVGEVKYGDIVIKNLLFQDDIESSSETRDKAQEINDKMEAMILSKGLKFNSDKSCFVISGSKAGRMKLQKEVDQSPLQLGQMPMKQVPQEKYLGFQISSSVSCSVSATVAKRAGAVTHAIYETRAVLEDCRASSAGGIMVAFMIWEASIIPNLLFGCENWIEISKKTLEKLNSLSHQFLKSVLGVGKFGTPLAALYWDTATPLMSNRILQHQLLFLWHLANLPEVALASEVYETQRKKGWGLVALCQPYLDKWSIEDPRHYSKYQWRKEIRSRMKQKNRTETLEWIKQYKKISYDHCVSEEYKMKPYFNAMKLSDIRMNFRMKYSMIQTIRLNFKGNRRYKSEGYRCPDCHALPEAESISATPQSVPSVPGKGPDNSPPVTPSLEVLDSQEHVRSSCLGNKDLCDGRDLNQTVELLAIFRENGERRDMEDDKRLLLID